MPPVLVVGTLAYDSVETPFGKVEEALGGSATYFSVAASFFTEVYLVGCIGKDFKDRDVQFLETRNIDISGLERLEGDTFRWSGKYGYDLNDAQTLATHLNVLSAFDPKLPVKFQSTEYVFLGNLDPVIQRKVLSQVKSPKLIACDTMNYWINGHYASLVETLKHVNILVINDGEVRQLTRESNLAKAARKILGWGPHTLVVKRGEYGAVMFTFGPGRKLSVFGAPAYPLEDVFDPTGAGDSFAGAFMGYVAGVGRTDEATLRQAVIFGSVIASFNVEKFSLDRLKELTFTEIELRYREFREMTHFEDLVDWR